MDAISGEIRLAHDHDFRPIKPGDWTVDFRYNFIVYKPQQLGFVVRNTGTVVSDVPPTDYAARLVHVCAGGKAPDREALDQLGKDAIHAFILLSEWRDIDNELPSQSCDAGVKGEFADDYTEAEAQIIAAEMAAEITEEILRDWPDFFDPSPSEPNDPEIPF